MKRLRILAFLALAVACFGQTFPQITTQQVTFNGTAQPQQVTQATINVVGAPGPQIYYVWIVANFPIGNATPSPAFMVRNAPGTLTGTNYLLASWFSVSGATSYDVLLTTNDTTPSGACNCAAATAVSGTTFQIKTNTLSSYTVNTYSGNPNFTIANPAGTLSFSGDKGTPLILFDSGARVSDLTATSPAVTPTSIEGVKLADQYGASGSAASTMGTVGAGSSVLTLAVANEFVNGQGIAVAHAGASASKGTPTGLGVVATCSGTCTTTYTYKIVALDGNGGVSAATTAVTASNNATLTFGHPGTTGASYNTLSWTSNGAAAYVIYGDAGTGGTLQIIGATHTNSFWDGGQGGYITASTWPWLPFHPPASALADWLITTVSSGGGSTAITLAASATTAAASQVVLHDDSAALSSCVAAGPCFVPPGTYNLVSGQLALAQNAVVYGSRRATTISVIGAFPALYTDSSEVTAHDLTVELASPVAQAAIEVDGESSTNNRNSFYGFDLWAPANTYAQAGVWLYTGDGNFGNYDNTFYDFHTARVDWPVFANSPFASLANGWQSPNLNTFTDWHSIYESIGINFRDASENSISNFIILGGYGTPTYYGVQLGDALSAMGAEYNRFTGIQCDQNSGAGGGVCVNQIAPSGDVLDNNNYINLHDADTTASFIGDWAEANQIAREGVLQSAIASQVFSEAVNEAPLGSGGMPTGIGFELGGHYSANSSVRIDSGGIRFGTSSGTDNNAINFANLSEIAEDGSGDLNVYARGTYVAHVYNSGSGNLPALACNNTGSINCGIGYPVGSLPAYNFGVAGTSGFAGAVALNGGATWAGTLSGATLNATALEQAGVQAALTIAMGTAALGTAAIASGACATAIMATATNATPSDSIEWADSSAPSANNALLSIRAYPTAGEVNFLVCNPTSSSITPAAETLNWRVIR